jgi:hypothetical protein
MPAAKRLVDNGARGREISTGKLFTRLVNGERRGYLGHAMWRRYLKLARGFTAAHPDGAVTYTAHELYVEEEEANPPASRTPGGCIPNDL